MVNGPLSQGPRTDRETGKRRNEQRLVRVRGRVRCFHLPRDGDDGVLRGRKREAGGQHAREDEQVCFPVGGAGRPIFAGGGGVVVDADRQPRLRRQHRGGVRVRPRGATPTVNGRGLVELLPGPRRPQQLPPSWQLVGRHPVIGTAEPVEHAAQALGRDRRGRARELGLDVSPNLALHIVVVDRRVRPAARS